MNKKKLEKGFIRLPKLASYTSLAWFITCIYCCSESATGLYRALLRFLRGFYLDLIPTLL